MSYSGEISASAAEATVLLAGAAIVGTALVLKGVADVATAAARAVHSAAQTAAVANMKSRLGPLMTEADSLNNTLEEQMTAASRQCYTDYEQTIQALTERCEREPDTTAFLEGCREAKRQLHENIAEKRRRLENGAVAEIRSTMQAGQALLSRERRETEASIQRVEDDLEKQRRAGALAEQALTEARAMAADFRSAYPDSSNALRAVEACEETIRQAEASVQAGQYMAALTTAYAARDTLLLRVTDMLTAECRNRQLFTDVSTALETARQLLEQHRSVNYTFRNTRSGQPVEKAAADFSVYYRGVWESLTAELEACAGQLSGQDLHDYSPFELQELLDRLSNWQDRFAQETALAYERLHIEMLRMETGRLLVQRYMANGYHTIPLTAEDKAVSPLDSLIVRLQKNDSEERLYLRLNAVPDAAGHVTMSIEMEDHTEYSGSDEEIEAARAAERDANCAAIRDCGIGQGLQLRHRCKNPGVLDTYQRQ